MIQLWTYNNQGVDWKQLHVDATDGIEVNFALKDFSTIAGEENNLSYFTYDLSVNDSPAFRASYGIPANKNVINQYRGKKVNAQLVADFKELNGEAVFLGYTYQNGCLKYQVQFIAGYRNWSAKLQDCRLCDLDFGPAVYSEAAIDAISADDQPYDGSTSYWWSLKYYGDNYSGSDLAFTLKCRRPDIYYKAIVDKIAEKAGTEIKSCFFETEYFRRLLAPYSGDNRFVAETINVSLDNDLPLVTGSNSFKFLDGNWTVIRDIGVLNDNPVIMGSRFLVFDDTEVTLKGTLIVSGVSGVAYLNLFNGLTGGDTFITSLTNGLNEIDYTFTVENQAQYQLIFGDGPITIKSGSNLQWCYKSDASNFEDEEIRLLCVLECCDVLDFWRGLSDIFNLVSFYDNLNNCLIVEPRFDVELPTGEECRGFYADSSKSVEWTNKIDCSTSDVNYFDSSISKNTTFRFCEDGNDEQQANEDFLSGQIRLSEKFTGEQDSEIKCIAPTLSREIPEYFYSGGFVNPRAVVPYLLNFDFDDDNANHEKSFDFKTRMLYKVGAKNGLWNAFSTADQRTAYPYATQYDDALGINLGFADRGNNLGILSIFYSKTKELWESGFFLEISGQLTLLDVCDLQSFFRTLKCLETIAEGNGRYFLEEANFTFGKCAKSNLKLTCF